MRVACRALLALVMLAGGGCAVGPDYREPGAVVTAAWVNSASVVPAADLAPERAWWQGFADPTLDRLVAAAWDENLDVAAALAKVEAARANAAAARAGVFPAVDASASATRSRGTGPSGGTGTAGGDLVISSAWSATADASWEIDLWGKRRREVEGALARVGLAQWDLHAARLTLIGDVASAYVELRSAERRLDIARAAVVARRETVSLTRSRAAAGLVTETDAVKAEAALATEEAKVPSLLTTLKQNAHRLAVLAGRPPGDLEAALGRTGRVPAYRGTLAAGVPADLVRRRPNIRRAERDLAAAAADIGVAEAELYPQLSLTGSVGASQTTTRVTTISAFGTWSLGPSLTLPIFDAGRRRAELAAKVATADQLHAVWRSTVLGGLEEVENALVALRGERTRRAALQRGVTSYEASVRQTQELYTRGLATFLDLLDATRSLDEARDALAQSEAQAAKNVITLFKALGGGWAAEPARLVSAAPRARRPAP